jgi:aminoglycoside-2''-adenylyltransferase
LEPLVLLKALDDHDVRFVLIGGLAAVLHGSPTITRDLDVCYARDPQNADRLAQALRQLQAKLRGAADDVVFLFDGRTLLAGDSFTFLTIGGPLDCLGTPAGTKGFDDLNANAVEMDIDGMKVRVVSLNDLIRMKRASGRPKDRIELEVLGALREELEKES